MKKHENFMFQIHSVNKEIFSFNDEIKSNFYGVQGKREATLILKAIYI